jgi:hypothetical protein
MPSLNDIGQKVADAGKGVFAWGDTHRKLAAVLIAFAVGLTLGYARGKGWL